MKDEKEESIVINNYSSAIEYLSARSYKINTLCDQLNLASGMAYIPTQTSFLGINSIDSAYVRPNDGLATSIFKPESTAYFAGTYQPNLISAVGTVQKQFNEFSTIQAHLPNINEVAAVSPMIGYARDATSTLVDLSKPSTIANLASSIEKNVMPWYGENIARSSYIPTSHVDLQETSKFAGSILGPHSLSSIAIQSSIIKATEYSLFAEKSIYPITTENFGSKILLSDLNKSQLASSFVEFSHGYSSFIKSYEQNPLIYTQLDPSISCMVPSEYFTSANLLEAISVEEDVTVEEEALKTEIQYENEILLSKYLPKVNEGLFKMWQGAVESFHSHNPDQVRHFSASLRELFTQIMHILAPNDEIKKWTNDPKHFHFGNPTRKTRLQYLCRNILSDSFGKFVDQDIETTLSLMELLHKGTHEIDSPFSQNQLITIKSKSESALKFLLEIHFKTNI